MTPPPLMVCRLAYHSKFHPRRDFADRTAVVHLADIICRAKGIGNPGDDRIPRVNGEAWAFLTLSMSDVERACEQLESEAEGMFGQGGDGLQAAGYGGRRPKATGGHAASCPSAPTAGLR